MTRSTSAFALLTTSSIRPGWMRPSAMSLVSDEAGDLATDGVEARQDHGLRGVVDDQVDAGRLLERADVAALAADDPALHLVAREVDDRDGVLGRVVGGDALHRGHDDLARLLLGLVAGPPLDRSRELDRVVLRLLADRLEQHALGVLGAEARDALEGDDLILDQAGQLFALLLEVPLAICDLAALLLEHVGPLVHLLVARQEASLEALELVPLRASLFLDLAAEAAASRPSPRGSCPSAGSEPRRRSGRPCPGRT